MHTKASVRLNLLERHAPQEATELALRDPEDPVRVVLAVPTEVMAKLPRDEVEAVLSEQYSGLQSVPSRGWPRGTVGKLHRDHRLSADDATLAPVSPAIKTKLTSLTMEKSSLLSPPVAEEVRTIPLIVE